MCLRFKFCTLQSVWVLHFLKTVKFVVRYPTGPLEFCNSKLAKSTKKNPPEKYQKKRN
jgi:hypothetical protein